LVKFLRNYSLLVQTQSGDTLSVEPPFTVEFDITRNTLTSQNVCSIRIYNLKDTNRNAIRKNIMDYDDYRAVELRAGYNQNLPVIFSGNITQCYSVREGTNFITAIECFDAGYAFENAETNQVFPANFNQIDILKSLAQSLPNVSLGAIGSFPGVLSRGASLNGATTDLLREITGGAFFIDNGKVYFLGDNECLEGEMQVINSQSGLLGTPTLEQTVLNFDMIFEPRLIVGQVIKLESITGANFNGLYKVISVKHRGTISPAVCGDAITSVGLWSGTGELSTVQEVID
jgi:hypothetical protein